MREIIGKTLDEERALYGSNDIEVRDCRFEGPQDGESALKESSNVKVDGCYFDLRYPLWHDTRVIVENSEMTENCRAPLWYSREVIINHCKLHGIKTLRECNQIKIEDSDIISTEFGWNNKDVIIEDVSAEGEYFMMNTKNIKMNRFALKGKYSFQYIENALFTDCTFDTKDAFWHAKNVIVRNCKIKGEYLAWYCENVTFDNCTIIGTQPLCYCKGLKLINCEMIDCDLSFEKSEVEASIRNPIISIKNPTSGHITLPYADSLIIDDPNAKCVIKEEKRR